MSKSKIRAIIVFGIAVVLVVVLRLACNMPFEVRSGPRIVMGTFARVVGIAANKKTVEACIEAAYEELTAADELMSTYLADSEISRANRDAFDGPVKVSGRTFEVLQKAIEFSELTDGAFDVTVGPLVELWKQAADANSVPTAKQLAAAGAAVGYDKLILDANDMSVRFAVEGMRLDLGGIAKGYAIDRAVEAMRAGGAMGGMVDVGGDILCFGVPPRGKEKWLIGLQDPGQATDAVTVGTPLLVLKLTDAAVATSGGYRRFALIEGERFSHIVDRATGSGAKSMSSVSIVAERAIDADALATAVSVMGPQKGLALIEKLPGTEAILLSPAPDYKLTKTAGAEQLIR